MMARTTMAAAALAALLAPFAIAPAAALDQPANAPAGAPAAPSGAPKDAAERGSSVAGKDAAANEMRANKAIRDENATMSDPNKNNK